MTPLITMLPGTYHHNAPWPLSSQFPMTPLITMLKGAETVQIGERVSLIKKFQLKAWKIISHDHVDLALKI